MSIEDGMYIRSGSIESDEELVKFLYILMRDYITAGTIEEIMKKLEPHKTYSFSNGYLACHAIDISKRLEKQ